MASKKKYEFRFPPLLQKLKRGPQIILPKDLGAIVAYSGMNKESIVVDAGTGSGFSTIFFASIAKKVYSFEYRKEFFDFSEKNIKRSALKNIVHIFKSVFEGISEIEEKIDIIHLDIPNPELIFDSKFNLSEDGCIVAYLPNIEQVSRFVSRASQFGFGSFTIEVFVREIISREKGTRPQNTAIVHTAYLTFCRKIKN
ncbi:MAG: tRNA (adenine-N1)-methyltransferase [Candidatus Micrarchaeota archaeon]|nr:tRNA (adenine-N1)-methyltransferase [Candidatus Micrarchaeota archaeon]